MNETQKTDLLIAILCMLFFMLGALVVTLATHLSTDNKIYYSLTNSTNIDFKFENELLIKDAVGLSVIDNDGKREIRILSGLDYENSLRICNHEVLHHLLCMEDEEPFVEVLDDYIRFASCIRFVNQEFEK